MEPEKKTIVNASMVKELMDSLNEDQVKVIDLLNGFIHQHIDKLFYLMGAGGTGKSFTVGLWIVTLICKLIDDLSDDQELDFTTFICTPTHTSLNNIISDVKKMSSIITDYELDKYIKPSTIQGFVGMTAVLNDNNGLLDFVH